MNLDISMRGIASSPMISHTPVSMLALVNGVNLNQGVYSFIRCIQNHRYNKKHWLYEKYFQVDWPHRQEKGNKL